MGSLAIQIEEEKLEKQVKSVCQLFSMIEGELEEGNFKEGLSFLDLKNDTLLSYMIEVCNILLLKVRNSSIEGHQSIERSIEYRVILEKIKGIDQRLAYQLNKLICSDQQSENQGVNISNLDVDDADAADEDNDEDGSDDEDPDNDNDDDESDDSDDSESDAVGKEEKVESKADKNLSSKPYRPPKLRSVVYEEESKEKKKRDIGEWEDKLMEKEKTRYEEENYTRLPDTKRKKKVPFKKGKKKRK